MNIAVILAGGSGERLGEETPKQFLKVAGKKIIEHTIEVMENSPLIDETVIVVRADYMDEMLEMVNSNAYKKVKKILSGGKERYESSLAAINAYTDDVNLIFHDAVRPLLNNRIIEDCISALNNYQAVDVAIPSTDTIIQVDGDGCIDNIPNRSLLRNGQTPQCFKLSVIKEAYNRALRDPNFRTTDDCGVLRRYMPEIPIIVVRGEVFNMKLTYKEDLFLLDKLFLLKSLNGEQEELLPQVQQQLHGKVLIVFGGSYGIGQDIVRIATSLGAKVYAFSRKASATNVANEQDVRKAINHVVSKEQRLDFVISTAGVLNKQPLTSMSYADVAESIDVNLKGVINVAKESYPHLRKSSGALLFYTSSSYTRGRMMYSIYSATKAAIVNFVQAISEEWFDVGVKVNCINPERTLTPMRIKNFGAEPSESLLKSETVAIASLNTLASELTGQVIDVRRTPTKQTKK